MRLRAENAPLRILEAGELVSAPLTFFDALLLSYASPKWQKSAKVVGMALTDFLRTSILQTDNLVLWARARRLALSGRFEF